MNKSNVLSMMDDDWKQDGWMDGWIVIDSFIRFTVFGFLFHNRSTTHVKYHNEQTVVIYNHSYDEMFIFFLLYSK